MTADCVAWACWLAALLLTARGDLDAEAEVARRAAPLSVREKALAKLHEVFGLPNREGKPHRHREVPPQFMVELYNAVAEPSGLTKGNSPYNAKVVRSFIERDNSKEKFFFFNISGLDPEEYVLEAELHLFRMRSNLSEDHRFHHSSPDCLLHVYQVLDERALSQPDLQRLLSAHYVSTSGSGWLVVNVKQAVLDWLSGRRPNLGLLVVATSLFGDPVRLNFARRDHHHNSKQPILVLFDGDRRQPVRDEPSTNTISDADSSPVDDELAPVQRRKRSAPGNNSGSQHAETSHTEQSQARSAEAELTEVGPPRDEPEPALDASSDNNSMPECSRYPLYVDFAKIGWGSWIVSPSGYDAFQCLGHCGFPLGLSQRPTNHATVQSIVHQLKLRQEVRKPCCVPTSLSALSLLYLDDESNVVLKNYEDMVALDCGCN